MQIINNKLQLGKALFLDEHFPNPEAATERCSLKNALPNFQKCKKL